MRISEIKLRDNYILVEQLPDKEVGGIIIPDEAQDPRETVPYRVQATGPEASVTPGQLALVSREAMHRPANLKVTPVSIRDGGPQRPHFIIPDDFIVAIFEGRR